MGLHKIRDAKRVHGMQRYLPVIKQSARSIIENVVDEFFTAHTTFVCHNRTRPTQRTLFSLCLLAISDINLQLCRWNYERTSLKMRSVDVRTAQRLIATTTIITVIRDVKWLQDRSVWPALMKLSWEITRAYAVMSRASLTKGLSARRYTNLNRVCDKYTRRLLMYPFSTSLIVATNEPAINQLVAASASRPLSFFGRTNAAEAGIQLAGAPLVSDSGPHGISHQSPDLTSDRRLGFNPERLKDNAYPRLRMMD